MRPWSRRTLCAGERWIWSLASAQAALSRKSGWMRSSPLGAYGSSPKTDALLDEMRKAGQPLAVVVDEYGGTAGIVTLHDLVEGLVGRIDEEPPPGVERRAPPRAEPDGSQVFDGLTQRPAFALEAQLPEVDVRIRLSALGQSSEWLFDEGHATSLLRRPIADTTNLKVSRRIVSRFRKEQ